MLGSAVPNEGPEDELADEDDNFSIEGLELRAVLARLKSSGRRSSTSEPCREVWKWIESLKRTRSSIEGDLQPFSALPILTPLSELSEDESLLSITSSNQCRMRGVLWCFLRARAVKAALCKSM